MHSDENSHLYAMNSLVALSKQVIGQEDDRQAREEFCKRVLI